MNFPFVLTAVAIAIILLIMLARELRHEVLTGTIADGTTASNSAAEFRNDSAGMIHIRGLDYDHTYGTAENDESATVEITKAPSFQSGTNNSPFFAWPQTVSIESGTTGAALDDVSVSIQGGKRWGRGQLTLEPNESLFVNVLKNTGGALSFLFVIEYEFG